MSWRAVTFVGYAVIAGLALVWQAVSVRRPSSVTLGKLMGWLAQTRAGGSILFLAWAWLGWHLFARGSAAFNR